MIAVTASLAVAGATIRSVMASIVAGATENGSGKFEIAGNDTSYPFTRPRPGHALHVRLLPQSEGDFQYAITSVRHH